jgi:hypothetical protein
MSFTNGWDGPKPYATQLGSTPARAEVALLNPEVGIIPLRPLQTGDILGGTFKAIRYAPLTTFGLTLFVLLIAELFGALGGLFLDRQLGGWIDPFGDEDFSDLSLFSSATVIALALTGLTSIVVAVGVMWVVAQAVRARRVTLQQTLRHMGRRLWPALGLSALFGLGALALIAPVVALISVGNSSSGSGSIGLAILLGLGELVLAVWVSTKLMLAPSVVAIEEVGPIRAIRRSWALTTGGFWRILAIYVLASFIISLASGTVSQVFSFAAMLLAMSQPGIGLTIASLASSLVSQVLTLPLSCSVLTLLYVDARIRREGYDLTLSEEMYG